MADPNLLKFIINLKVRKSLAELTRTIIKLETSFNIYHKLKTNVDYEIMVVLILMVAGKQMKSM